MEFTLKKELKSFGKYINQMKNQFLKLKLYPSVSKTKINLIFQKILKDDITLYKSVFSIPYKRKKLKGGEDAYLDKKKLLVVADGVGSWKSLGVDPAKYALSLCENIKHVYKQLKKDGTSELNPREIIEYACDKVNVMGSSTCCIILFDSEKKQLKTASVGDSLYMIARYSSDDKKFDCFFKSEEQMHKFNQPYQLGTNGDSPKSAITQTHDVIDKDVIILATDGLWDNLTDETILNILNQKNIEGIVEIENNSIAEYIARLAQEKSFDLDYESPFSNKAKQFGKFYIKGGKPDDITVIISQIRIENDLLTKSESFPYRLYYSTLKLN